jgi:hypothetical protein
VTRNIALNRCVQEDRSLLVGDMRAISPEIKADTSSDAAVSFVNQLVEITTSSIHSLRMELTELFLGKDRDAVEIVPTAIKQTLRMRDVFIVKSDVMSDYSLHNKAQFFTTDTYYVRTTVEGV